MWPCFPSLLALFSVLSLLALLFVLSFLALLSVLSFLALLSVLSPSSPCSSSSPSSPCSPSSFVALFSVLSFPRLLFVFAVCSLSSLSSRWPDSSLENYAVDPAQSAERACRPRTTLCRSSSTFRPSRGGSVAACRCTRGPRAGADTPLLPSGVAHGWPFFVWSRPHRCRARRCCGRLASWSSALCSCWSAR